MKNTNVSLWALSTLAAGMLAASAATTTKTSYVMNVGFALSGYEQGSGRAYRITSKDVIANLGSGLNVTFSKSAKLLRKATQSSTSYIVRDKVGTTMQDFDVTSCFAPAPTDQVVVTVTNGASTTLFMLFNISFTNAAPGGAHCSLTGFAKATAAPVFSGGPDVYKCFTMNAAGSGVWPAVSSDNMVLTGTVTLNGGRLE